MNEEQYRNLEIGDLVYNTKLKIVRVISSRLTDKSAQIPDFHCLWTNDLTGEYLSGSEGILFKERDVWHTFKDTEPPEWAQIKLIMARIQRLEEFVYSRLH